MSKTAPAVVSISTPRYGEVVRTADNRVIYTPTPLGWTPGEFVSEFLSINMIADSPPETAVTDAAELRLQDALNEKAERTTAFDVALQGLQTVIDHCARDIGPYEGRLTQIRTIQAVAEVAYSKAKAYRAEECARLNEGLRAQRDRAQREAAENSVLLATQEDARRQADQLASEVGRLREDLAHKHAANAVLLKQRDRYRSELADIRSRVNDQLSAD